ncbi:hypothetical protein MJO28_001135 [Puccinia striiformis f. sp. tritici]|uniref:Uncharacterized protein n=3 Tax=Puccinia striiformis TaxID=27350 RepID=A0A0L0VBD0_9BASI|nr:hypothetical protein Pst134EA_000107 [Puccinia striiformis f. sp. tritici]KAI9601627.1 hypothetical protein H4Q26_001459 [Puccinia striiformis f. sp. tritici PST-130]KNE96573.1 hypothetical protein PSTG_10131 [Puccinia striiformis f. sp. tritici PST-78]POW08417.1 hypothetical protein PSTT_07557 [Puccinia striiformis]KAH9466244.1 hypothetical protein Pst134EB_001303 [Puccinia striiformis f. sp. tritici]KAH9473029.1 hypothetical protein Pst134EA_000107 [Puccinia striiformis f. sp. tritici]
MYPIKRDIKLLYFLNIFLSLVSALAAQIGLTAQHFLLHGSHQNNIKLSWPANPDVHKFSVIRKSGRTSSVIALVQGNIHDDYDVPDGTLTYQVLADGDPSKKSEEVTISSQAPFDSSGFHTYDNTKASKLKTIANIKLGSTYYSYVIKSDSDGMSHIIERISPDGYTFSGNRVVLTRKEVCEGTADGFCKLEAVTFVQNPQSSEVLMWAHWENKQDYGQARVAVAFGQPGGEWKFGGSFRPLGYDSRDLTFFQDNDGSGYLISSTAMNTNMNIYKLTADWRNVSSLVSTVLKGERREAPSLINQDNIYYLFTSKAAGWYPSAGQYISATSLSGPWSQSRNIGNLAGFGAQSGQVQKIGSSWVMCANQWSGQWLDPEPPSRQVLLPIALSNGYADYHYYHKLKYPADNANVAIYGVQSGMILSVGQKSSSSIASIEGFADTNANNGVNLNPNNLYQSSVVPFSYDIELQPPSTVTQFDLTTKLVGGSETAYQFTISGQASPTSEFQLIFDKSNNTRVGFVTGMLSTSTVYSAVRLNVQRILNVHNRKEANWAQGISQFTVYGETALTEPSSTPRVCDINQTPSCGMGTGQKNSGLP